MEERYWKEQQLASQAQIGGLDVPRHIPLRVQLEHELQQHRREIERITQLIELMDKNPAIEQFINLQRGYTL